MRSDNTILLNGKGHHDEGVADTAIRPGTAITLASDNKYDEATGVQATLLKGGLKIAKEDGLRGKTVDDAYAANDIVQFYIPVPGDRLNVLVKTGADIDVGDKLIVEGGGSGLWIEAAGTEARFQAEALEDSGGALAAATLIRVRILC